MVSFQAPSSQNSRKANADLDINLSNKRKLEEIIEGDQETFDKRSTKAAENTKSIFDIELHLETPLPLEWERFLDIQSGEIHFYNTRTHKKTTGDPWGSPDQEAKPAGHMSLDLELNLHCDSQRKKQAVSNNITRQNSTSCPPRHQEMVATACMRCHMLVMLCKSSPTCPNCKFLHPPDQSLPKLFKQRRFSFLC